MIERARDLLARSFVWNNHTCLPLRAGDESLLPEIEREARAGIDVTSINVGFGPQSFESHMRVLATMRAWFARNADRYALLRTPADLDAARSRGVLAVAFDIEGMAIFDDGFDGIPELLSDVGVRWISIAYNSANRVGGGCYGDDPGLSEYGAEVLRDVQRAGILVCCSHTGHRTVRDAFALLDGPMIFSHSNCSAVYDHARNISDDLILACARSGGVVGINGIGAFLSPNDDDLLDAYVAHLDHAVQVAGPDHVGISLDYVYDTQELLEYIETMRTTFPDESAYRRAPHMLGPEALPEIVARLYARGYDDEPLQKILGGNWRRVTTEVWR